MDTQENKMRVGLVVSDGPQPPYIADFIHRSLNAEQYCIDKILIQHQLPAKESLSISQKIENKFFAFIKKLERKILPKSIRFRAYFSQQPVETLPIEKVYLSDLKDKFSEKMPFDLLVVSHTLAFEDDFLAMAKLGLVLIEPLSPQGDHKKTPLGFHEVYSRRPSTTFLIQLINKHQQCQTLYKGKAYTGSHYLMNEINVIERAYFFLHHVLTHYDQITHKKSALNPRESCGKPAIVPTLSQQVSYLFKTFLHLLEKKSWKLRKVSHRWGVAFQFTKDWQHANLAESIVIKNPPNHFLADPFIVTKNGQHFCFVEDLDYATKKGKITVYQINQNTYTPLGTALEEAFHLSYPFMFEVAGKLYMCPETYQANEIQLYECIDFPLGWKKHKVLKSNVSAADTNIFQWNNQWWMFTNIDSLGHDEHHSELHLFYADAFDANEWHAHPQNPVIHDPLKARNGGLLFKDNAVYRVFQQHGFDNYGESMGIAKITQLDCEHYSEEVLYKIPADFLKNLSGTHTYTFEQGLLAIDFKKLEKIKT
jgi:hypothetical protein